MSASGLKSLPSIGFLTVQEHADHGLFGGYLVLNPTGRPLEFHCTAPVKANRAQEILYGPTLKPYLYGEQIGQTLVAKATSSPLMVCTDVEPALALRDAADIPVVWLTGDANSSAGENPDSAAEQTVAADSGPGTFHRVDGPHPPPPPLALCRFRLGGWQLAVANRHAADRDLVTQRWHEHIGDLDLAEPFGRIRDAIQEAQRGAR